MQMQMPDFYWSSGVEEDSFMVASGPNSFRGNRVLKGKETEHWIFEADHLYGNVFRVDAWQIPTSSKQDPEQMAHYSQCVIAVGEDLIWNYPELVPMTVTLWLEDMLGI